MEAAAAMAQLDLGSSSETAARSISDMTTTPRPNWRKRKSSLLRKSLSKSFNNGIARRPFVEPAGLTRLKAVLDELPKSQSFKHLIDESARARKRDHQLHEVLEEIITTESNYLDDVQFIWLEFAVPLRPLLSAVTFESIFANLEQLCELHTTLAADLVPARQMAKSLAQGVVVAAQHPTEELAALVARAFDPFIPRLMLYAGYCGTFADAPAKLRDAEQRSKTVAAIVSAKQDEAHTALEALLFRPVQRMCVYPLLFKQALKHLPDASPAHGAFTSCADAISRTIGAVNEDVRRHELHAKTRHVLTEEIRHASHLITPERELVFETCVRCQRVDATLRALGTLLHRKRVCTLFVLTDMVLVCRMVLGGGYARVATMPLNQIDVALNASTAVFDEGAESATDNGTGDGNATALASRGAAGGAAGAAGVQADVAGPEDSSTSDTAKRQWMRASRWVASDERKQAVLRHRSQRSLLPMRVDDVDDPSAGGSFAVRDRNTTVGVALTDEASIPAPPPRFGSDVDGLGGHTRRRSRYVSVPRAAWNNLLTIAEAQLAGDPAPWEADDDLYGERQSASLTIIHHGEDGGGGLYKLWAASDAEGRALVRQLTELQTALRAKTEALKLTELKAELRAKAEALEVQLKESAAEERVS